RRRRARIPAICADNPIWAEPIPGVTEKAYSRPPDMCDVLESEAGSDASCLLVQTSTLAGAHPARREAQNRWFPTRSESTNIRRPAPYRRGGGEALAQRSAGIPALTQRLREAQNRWFPTRGESTNIRRPAPYRRGG